MNDGKTQDAGVATDSAQTSGSVLDWKDQGGGKFCAEVPPAIFTLHWCNGRVHLIVSGSTQFDIDDLESGKAKAEQMARELVEAWAESLTPNDKMRRGGETHD